MFTQVYSAFLLQEIRRRGLNVSVAGIPKTIDNDIPVTTSSCRLPGMGYL